MKPMKPSKFNKNSKLKTKKRAGPGFLRKKSCRFCRDKVETIDYKDLKIMEAFIKERGRMTSSRYSGNCAKHQRQVTEGVKRARHMALLPYVRL
ncbi:30S ribosomal protein S18 [bacterium]|nr:MAG: 30S ribosomal protein S18 [bacterium]